jgi:hypothetical protein
LGAPIALGFEDELVPDISPAFKFISLVDEPIALFLLTFLSSFKLKWIWFIYESLSIPTIRLVSGIGTAILSNKF